MTNSLFRERIPEAAAQQLAVVVAWLTECQLATLEELQGRTRVAKHELKRQTDICDEAVRHCAELGVSARGLRGRLCSRLAERFGQGGDASACIDQPTESEQLRSLLQRYAMLAGELSKGLQPDDPLWVDLQELGGEYDQLSPKICAEDSAQAPPPQVPAC